MVFGFGRKESIADSFKLDRVFDAAQNTINTYQLLVVPVIGKEEFAKRVMTRFMLKLEKNKVNLSKETLEEVYSRIGTMIVEKGIDGYFLMDYLTTLGERESDILKALRDHIDLFRIILEQEERFSPEHRIITDKEFEKLAKMLADVFKHVDTAFPRPYFEVAQLRKQMEKRFKEYVSFMDASNKEPKKNDDDVWLY